MTKEVVQNTELANKKNLSTGKILLIGTLLLAGITSGYFIGRDNNQPTTFRIDTESCGAAFGAPIDAYTINPLSDDQIGIITLLTNPNVSIIYDDENREFLLKCGLIAHDFTPTSIPSESA